MVDVTVVGAGPIGCLTASYLAPHCKVHLIDSKSEPDKNIVCSGIVSKEAVELLGCKSCIIRKIESVQLALPESQQTIDISDAIQEVYIIDRPTLNKKLLQDAINKGVTLTIEKCEKIEKDSHYILACGHVGASLILNYPLNSSLIGIQKEYYLPKTTKDVTMFLNAKKFKGGFAWVVRTAEHTDLVGLLHPLHSRTFNFEDFTMELFERNFIGFPTGMKKSKTVPGKWPRKPYGSNYILVGEAAGQVKPTTGGGLYFGALCAKHAATAMLSKLNGNNKAFATYQKACEKAIGPDIIAGEYLTTAYRMLDENSILFYFGLFNKLGLISFDHHSTQLFRSIK